MAIGGLHVDSHRIPGGVKYTAFVATWHIRTQIFQKKNHTPTFWRGPKRASRTIQAIQVMRNGQRYSKCDDSRKISTYSGAVVLRC